MKTALDRARFVAALRALRQICQPAALRGDALTRLAVDRDDVDAPHRPAERLVEELQFFGDANPKLVLFGSLGSGKSTELARLDRHLGRKYLIVGLDPANSGARRGDPSRRGILTSMTAEELVFLSGLAIAEAAKRVWSLDLEPELERLKNAAQPLAGDPASGRLDLGRLAKNLFLFGTTVVDPTGLAQQSFDLMSKVTDAVDAKVDFGSLLRRSAQPQVAIDLLEAVNDIIRAVERRGGRPPLLLIDETDKIEDPDISYRLLTDHDLVASLACPVVLAGPNSLLGDRAPMLAAHGYATGNQLYHVRVWQTEAPTEPDEAGLAKMIEVLDKRIAAVCEDEGLVGEYGDLVTAGARRLLAQMSGGVIRDLLGLLSEAARAAIVDRTEPTRLTLEHARQAVDVRRREREVFQPTEHIDVLREVARRRTLAGGDVGLRLLERNHILMYSNDHPWYYPHALLLNLLEHHAVLP